MNGACDVRIWYERSRSPTGAAAREITYLLPRVMIGHPHVSLSYENGPDNHALVGAGTGFFKGGV